MDKISYSLAAKAIKGLLTKANIKGSSVLVPRGDTLSRPVLTASEVAIRYNTDTFGTELWDGSAWVNLSADITAVNLKGVDTEANILLITDAGNGDLWIASDTLDGWVYDGIDWINIGPLQGPQGVKGDQGNSITSVVKTAGNGDPGTVDTYTITFTDLTTTTFEVTNGNNGTGITSVVRTSGDGSEGTVDTYTITYDDTSTSTFEVRNGTAGTIHHIAKTDTVGTTDTYTVYADAAETQPLGTFEVYNGVDGELEGLGTAATRDVGTSDGQLPEFVSNGEGLGGFGYGRAGTSVGQYTDLNDVPKRTGFYLLTEGHPNSTNNKAPLAGFYDTAILRTLRQSTNDFVDVYLPYHQYSNGMVLAPHTSSGYATQRIVSDSVNLRTSTGNSTTYPMSQKATTDALETKVDKVTGKQLSTEDYTTDDKNKLNSYGTNATGARTVSADDPSEGVDGDIWLKY